MTRDARFTVMDPLVVGRVYRWYAILVPSSQRANNTPGDYYHPDRWWFEGVYLGGHDYTITAMGPGARQAGWSLGAHRGLQHNRPRELVTGRVWWVEAEESCPRCGG